jgi:hypothetical protein
VPEPGFKFCGSERTAPPKFGGELPGLCGTFLLLLLFGGTFIRGDCGALPLGPRLKDRCPPPEFPGDGCPPPALPPLLPRPPPPPGPRASETVTAKQAVKSTIENVNNEERMVKSLMRSGVVRPKAVDTAINRKGRTNPHSSRVPIRRPDALNRVLPSDVADLAHVNSPKFGGADSQQP